MEKIFQISNEYNKEKVVITTDDNMELLMGQILLNRIAGIAYEKIDLETLHYEARKVLKFHIENNILIFNRFINNLSYLSPILQNADFPYALLKGAFLTLFLYPKGHRTSNDIDVLISNENVSTLQSLLLQNGFTQGHVSKSSGEVVPASRKEIIESKMNYGETVPFIKLMEGYPLEVDINFSLDYKPSKEKNIISEMLSKAIFVEKDGICFKTLNHKDFLIHLCCHLYKEATTYDWIKWRNDLMLYKFSDINVFLHEYGCEKFFLELDNRIKHFALEKECYYTFEISSTIYPDLNDVNGFARLKESIKPNDLQFMTQVIYPMEKKRFQYSMKFIDWFLCPNRIMELEEIPYEEN